MSEQLGHAYQSGPDHPLCLLQDGLGIGNQRLGLVHLERAVLRDGAFLQGPLHGGPIELGLEQPLLESGNLVLQAGRIPTAECLDPGQFFDRLVFGRLREQVDLSPDLLALAGYLVVCLEIASPVHLLDIGERL